MTEVHQPTVLDAIENWFGEELSADLAGRASSLPMDQLVDFLETVEDATATTSLPAKSPGQTRPLAYGRDSIIGSLMFADTVAIMNPAEPEESLTHLREFRDANYPVEKAVQHVAKGLEELSELKPLLDAGLVEILPVGINSLVRTAAREAHEDPTLRATLMCIIPPDMQALYVELAPDYYRPEEYGWVETAFEGGEDTPIQSVINSLIYLRLIEDDRLKVDVPFHPYWIDQYVAILQTTANVFTHKPTKQELRRSEEWLESVYGTSDMDEAGTREKLLSLDIPRFDRVAFSDIRMLRESSDELAGFRASMRAGFRDVESISAESADWKREAKECMNDALALQRSQIAKELKKSSAIKQSIVGTKKLGVSAIAGGTAWQVGGNITTALTSAVATAVGQTAMDLIEAQRSRARQQAVLNVYGIFDYDGEM